MSELFLFILSRRVTPEAVAPKPSEVFRFTTRVEKGSSIQKKNPSARRATLGLVDELNPRPGRRSGCASAEPYPATEQRQSSQPLSPSASAKNTGQQNAHFDPTIILVLI